MSDTHNMNFDNPDHCLAFRPPVPQAHVLLHCGDLTNFGSLQAYERALELLGRIPAELKLVIAGNHELSLDEGWWQENAPGFEDPSEHQAAMSIMRGKPAEDAGVTYLEEGLHEFTLSNGARFSIYTSPYQPVGRDLAFRYDRNEDRWNRPSQCAWEATPMGAHPIPDFPNVDIVMTHGPPYGVLDKCNNISLGCNHLRKAIGRARPRLHCFGRVHEDSGALLGGWQSFRRRPDGLTETLAEPELRWKRLIRNGYPSFQRCGVRHGDETLMVNACIMNEDHKLRNRPWLFELDLPMSGSRGMGFCCASKPAALG